MTEESRKIITYKYLDYIKTGNDESFTYVYNNLNKIFKSEFGNNQIFNDYNFEYEFDDIFQMLMIKLYQKKDKFDISKGRLVPWAYSIFKNTLIDQKRKVKMNKVNIECYGKL